MHPDHRRARLAAARLYLVCDVRPGGRRLADVLRPALQGGVDIVQLREKSLTDEELLPAAREAVTICEAAGALLIINDRPAVALQAGADGVHLGQDDEPLESARALLGPQAIIGLSTHAPHEVDAAAAQGADYIGVGPVNATPTKPGRPAVGLELVQHAAAHATLPWFAIGGLDPKTAPAAVEAGARRLAVVRAIAEARNPRAAAATLRALLPVDDEPAEDDRGAPRAQQAATTLALPDRPSSSPPPPRVTRKRRRPPAGTAPAPDSALAPSAAAPAAASADVAASQLVYLSPGEQPEPGMRRLTRREASALRDEALRTSLTPIGPHERPRPLLAAVAVSALLAIGVIVGVITDHHLSHNGGSVIGGAFLAAVLVFLSGAMWQKRYIAVLAFEALIAFQVLVTCLALTVVSGWRGLVVCLIGIVGGGWLFWKLIRVMARLQVPRTAAAGARATEAAER